MTLKDTFILVGSKLKIRKARTIITVVTISVLFSIVIASLFVMKGFSGSVLKYSQITFDGRVMLKVEHDGIQPIRDPAAIARAIELYENSTDPNEKNPVITPDLKYDATPYIDSYNPITKIALQETKSARAQAAMDAISEFAATYEGRAMAIERMYATNGFIDISQMIDPTALQYHIDFNSHAPCWNSCPGGQAIVVEGDSSILDPFVQIFVKKDDVIQVLVPLNRAAQAIGINVPSSDGNPDEIRSYIETVNQEAIGRRFIGTMTVDTTGDGQNIEATEITYEIVGLLPAESEIQYGVSNIADIIDAFGNNIFEAALTNLGIFSVYQGDAAPFVVTNPDSSAFKASYTTDLSSQYTQIIIAFDDVETAELFIQENQHIYPRDFLNNMREVFYLADALTGVTVTVVIVLSVIAAIVMFGTVSRVIDDESRTIALYRAVGASTGNIHQVFLVYMATLSFLIVLGSTIIGLVLSGVVAITNTAFVTARISLIYNLPDIASVSLLGFDPRILLVYLAIFTVGGACLALIFGKLTSKNIVKDLRK